MPLKQYRKVVLLDIEKNRSSCLQFIGKSFDLINESEAFYYYC